MFRYTLALAASALLPTSALAAEPTAPSAVLVELFTSEGCSSCPPADKLLEQVNGQRSAAGQLIIGISEHVAYWNGLGWRDPFSSEQYTDRQNAYSQRFGISGPYTPQMVVNGREQFVGSDREGLQQALATESGRPGVQLQILDAEVNASDLVFSYQAMAVPAGRKLQLVAVLVDDADKSHVLRGENGGRSLEHVFVARAFAPLGPLGNAEGKTVHLPLPEGLSPSSQPRHLVIFAQEEGLGAVSGVATKAL